MHGRPRRRAPRLDGLTPTLALSGPRAASPCLHMRSRARAAGGRKNCSLPPVIAARPACPVAAAIVLRARARCPLPPPAALRVPGAARLPTIRLRPGYRRAARLERHKTISSIHSRLPVPCRADDAGASRGARRSSGNAAPCTAHRCRAHCHRFRRRPAAHQTRSVQASSSRACLGELPYVARVCAASFPPQASMRFLRRRRQHSLWTVLRGAPFAASHSSVAARRPARRALQDPAVPWSEKRARAARVSRRASHAVPGPHSRRRAVRESRGALAWLSAAPSRARVRTPAARGRPTSAAPFGRRRADPATTSAGFAVDARSSSSLSAAAVSSALSGERMHLLARARGKAPAISFSPGAGGSLTMLAATRRSWLPHLARLGHGRHTHQLRVRMAALYPRVTSLPELIARRGPTQIRCQLRGRSLSTPRYITSPS
ncbi:hypothetical protein AURDEDRAFT_175826 [Auricularia subglabra TFB-10046 SS5]|uniref:Uncharacterized protein n=1 Tax=Auricularia subglabra (strain TFB-10046 / SS5) TaxID=717982 RepID=J0D7J1_AURST|nr:hypothetical protein AURDEDRAFT_175826 [Auricularia subglabra TFB-10046 SS5]